MPTSLCHTWGHTCGIRVDSYVESCCRAADVLTIADLAVLEQLLKRGTLPYLQKLWLCDNVMNDEGIAALIHGTGNGSLGSLRYLSLFGNRIGDTGMKAFSDWITTGALGSLKYLDLSENNIGAEGMKAFSAGCCPIHRGAWVPSDTFGRRSKGLTGRTIRN